MRRIPPLCLLLLLLSILFYTATADFTATSSNWHASAVTEAHAVKAFDYLGPEVNTAHGSPPYNSTLNEAPLQLLSVDKDICRELLSGTIASFINATVLIDTESLVSVCHFNFMYENPTSLVHPTSS